MLITLLEALVIYVVLQGLYKSQVKLLDLAYNTRNLRTPVQMGRVMDFVKLKPMIYVCALPPTPRDPANYYLSQNWLHVKTSKLRTEQFSCINMWCLYLELSYKKVSCLYYQIKQDKIRTKWLFFRIHKPTWESFKWWWGIKLIL